MLKHTQVEVEDLLSEKRGPRHWVLPLLAILMNRRPKLFSY